MPDARDSIVLTVQALDVAGDRDGKKREHSAEPHGSQFAAHAVVVIHHHSDSATSQEGDSKQANDVHRRIADTAGCGLKRVTLRIHSGCTEQGTSDKRSNGAPG